MSQFADLTSRGTNSQFAPLAHYYYGLAANKIKKYNESNNMLLQLLSRYPGWEEKDEALYLLAANYLALQDYKRGFEYLSRIGDPQLGKDIQGLKQFFIKEVDDLQTLKTLNTQYPNDRIVAQALVKLIQEKSSSRADLELSDQLTNQFGIEVIDQSGPKPKEETQTRPAYEKKWTKGYYNVAVLFPYRLSEYSPRRRSLSNQYAFDFYSGLQLAKQQLQTEGILVNIQAYDVGNEENTVLEVVNNKHFGQVDLIFGPLYTRPFELVSSFANLNNIVMVNPLATDGSLLENGKWVYLAHPSIQAQAQEVVELAKRKNRVPVAAVYYGPTSKDSAMAYTYRDELLKAGGKVLELKQVSNSSASINERVSQFATTKPNHVVLFSNEPKAGQALMSVLSGRQLNDLPVIAVANSFDFNRSRPSGYGSNLYLIQTDYVDITKEEIKDFQLKYYEKTNTLPSIYSYQGYDQMLFFGRMLAKYKEKVKDGIELRKYEDGFLLSGFDYTESRENTITSILKYEGGRWVPLD
jgi:ABC-type branched-subunit amino acid transport system substrate-binding protein